jgi:nucleoside phosphorylase/CheY-like chemotaxis protein
MIQILVVDDNKLRINAVREIVQELRYQDSQLEYVESIIEAKTALLKTKYDVMLLDLVIPLRAGNEPQENGGLNLLQEITGMPNYNIPKHTVVISEYDTALGELEKISNEIVFTSIKYDSTSSEWRTRLKGRLEYFNREGDEQLSFDYDVAIVCALETPELSEIKKLPFEWVPYNEPGDSTDYFVGQYKGKKVICAAAYEMGMSASAILATKISRSFRPQYLIMTGIAGGVKEKGLRFGDVVVADPCFDYESGKRVFENGTSKFKPDYKQIRLDDTVQQIIRRLSGQTEKLHSIWNMCGYEKPETVLQVKIGPFGSGASVLSDLTVVERVLEHNRKFLAYDMEAYAIMLAGALSSMPKPIPIVMKAISDFGEGKDDRYQKYAAYTSARFLELLLEEMFKN